jgi:hypothetical protein
VPFPKFTVNFHAQAHELETLLFVEQLRHWMTPFL